MSYNRAIICKVTFLVVAGDIELGFRWNRFLLVNKFIQAVSVIKSLSVVVAIGRWAALSILLMISSSFFSFFR